MRVLVAEDDRAIALALQMVVEDLGHSCDVAPDGLAAWEHFSTHGADVIVSDWRMPGLEGPDLCRRVRAATADTPYVYFIMVTVMNRPLDILEGMTAGADDFLTKPFSIDTLHARLIAAERVTGLHRRLAEHRAESEHLAEERGRLLEARARERSQLVAVLQQLPAGVMIAAAPGGEIILANDRIAEIWRQPHPGPTIFEHDRQGYAPDGHRYGPREWPLARAIVTGEVVTGEEIEIVRGDGSTGTLRVNAAPIREGDRIVAGVVVTEDITTERQRQHDAVQAEKLRALGQLASGVAHDLNQSLALVTGYAEMARGSLDVPSALDLAELREMLSIVSQAAYDGGETVKRLLTFSRGSIEGASEPVHLSTLLSDVAKLTAPRWRDAMQAEGRPIAVHIDAAGDAIVDGWPASLREALTNLIFNAIDALPDGGTIALRARREGDWAVVEVADSGVGMSAEVEARIFEPFFTTKGDGGTGLGLPMVFGIVQRHRGRIEIESAPGRGTVIRLSLPAASTGLSSGPVGADHEGRLTHRILVVDDDEAIGKMVARILRTDQHTVTVVPSAEDALARLDAQPYDVVLSDIGLGAGLNGWQLAAAIRERWPVVRIILATGWGASIDPDAARARGIAAILAKPYRPHELTGAIDAL